jgi:hypothetical protein
VATLCAGSLRTVIPTSREAQIGGDAMVAGNGFYKEQTIDARGGLRLSGPLELEKDQTLSKMYIWLWQSDENGTGAAATVVLDESDLVSAAASKEGGAEWRTMVRPAHGKFRAGPATGMALAILERNGRTTPYWWSDSNIRLDHSGDPDVTPGVNTKIAQTLRDIADTLTRR